MCPKAGKGYPKCNKKEKQRKFCNADCQQPKMIFGRFQKSEEGNQEEEQDKIKSYHN